jgi:hypothetical protein
MDRKRSLQYLNVELSKIYELETASNKILNSLQKIRQNKRTIINNIDSFQSFRDLKSLVNLEKRYMKMILQKFFKIYNTIKDIESDLINHFDNLTEAKSFFSELNNLFSRVLDFFSYLNEQILKEEKIIKKRSGLKSIFFHLRKSALVNTLKLDSQNLLQAHNTEEKYLKTLAERIIICQQQFSEKASILILSEKQSLRQGRLSKNMSQEYNSKQKLDPSVNTAEKNYADAKINTVKEIENSTNKTASTILLLALNPAISRIFR